MAITDTAKNPLNEQDWVAVAPSLDGPFVRARIASIDRIIDRSPYNGGTKVTLIHKIEMMIPPGHTGVPVMKVIPSADEQADSDRAAKGLPDKEKSSLVGSA